MLRRSGSRAPAAVAVVAWLAGLFALDSITGDGNLQGLLAVGSTVVLGAVVGRWWLLAVPWLVLLGLMAYAEFAPPNRCVTCEDDMPFLGVVLIGVFEAFVAQTALLIGLAVHEMASAIAPRRARRRAAARK